MTRLAGQVALDQGIDHLYHHLHVQVAISEPYEVSSCRNLHDSDSPLLERVRLVVSGAGLQQGGGLVYGLRVQLLSQPVCEPTELAKLPLTLHCPLISCQHR